MVGMAQYQRRLRDQPGAISNLYFAYMLTLCALHECQELLNGEDYLGDADFVRPLMQELTGAAAPALPVPVPVPVPVPLILTTGPLLLQGPR